MKKIALIVVFLMFISFISGCNFTSEKSLTLNNFTVHYTNDATMNDAKNLISFIKEEIQPKNGMEMLLDKKDGTYTVGLITGYSNKDDINGDTRFYMTILPSRMSQSIFGGAPVVLNLLDEDRNVLLSEKSRYAYVEQGKVTLYYDKAIPKDSAQKVLDYLVTLGGDDTVWDLILEKSESGYHLKAVSSFQSESEITQEDKTMYRNMAERIRNILQSPVTVDVIDITGNKLYSVGS